MNRTLDAPGKLRAFNLFDHLGDEDLAAIAADTQVRDLAADQVVCEEDTVSDSMFFISEGLLEVSKHGVAFATLKDGDYFGEMSLITGGKRNATVRTLEPSLLFEISATVFDSIFARFPRALHNLLITYDQRLRRHNDTVVEQLLKLRQQYRELEINHQRLLLSDKMASIGLLTAGIAHEINNPLFVITGYLDVLNESIERGQVSSEELIEISEKLGVAARSILKLVSGIKTYARIEDTDPVPIDLNSAIEDSLGLVAYLYSRDDIELKTAFATDSPVILGNLGKLQQVLMNLLSNARDALESSENKTVSVITREEPRGVLIDVSDTGCGIEPQNIRDVFSRAFTTKPVGKGSGMGLDLVRELVEEMDGTIEVESEVGSGTTFRLVFPRFRSGDD
jgi:signal transduction histidine kinase